MTNLRLNLIIWALAAAQLGALTSAVLADAQCFCVISKDDLDGHQHRSGVCQDLTGIVFKFYPSMSSTNQADCSIKCGLEAVKWVGRLSVATNCCAIGASNGAPIRTFSALGTKNYRPSYSGTNIGTLVNTPAVSPARCPDGWSANTTGVVGGITNDGKCKKLVGTIDSTPLPFNGTPIGNWGFTWGNQVIAWGTFDNGGAEIVTSACHF